MTVIGEYQVREEAKKGRRQIVFLPGDIITPQARETIGTLGLELVEGPLPVPEPRAADPATAIRRVLYRSSPRWMAPDPPVGRPRRLARLAVVGAGNVGTTVAHLAAASDMASEITLMDVVAGLAASVALDVEHTSGITGSSVRVTGGSESGLLTGAEVVVITAGRPRSPGMDRAGLISINGRVVRSVAEEVAAHAPDAVIVVVTNPLDEMTYEALSASGFPRRQVLGMAGTLDSSRFRYLLAREAGVSPKMFKPSVWDATVPRWCRCYRGPPSKDVRCKGSSLPNRSNGAWRARWAVEGRWFRSAGLDRRISRLGMRSAKCWTVCEAKEPGRYRSRCYWRANMEWRGWCWASPLCWARAD